MVSVTVADLQQPCAVTLVAPVHLLAARELRAAIGPAADFQSFKPALRLSSALKLTLRAMIVVSPFSRSVAIVSVKAYEGA